MTAKQDNLSVAFAGGTLVSWSPRGRGTRSDEAYSEEPRAAPSLRHSERVEFRGGRRPVLIKSTVELALLATKCGCLLSEVAREDILTFAKITRYLVFSEEHAAVVAHPSLVEPQLELFFRLLVQHHVPRIESDTLLYSVYFRPPPLDDLGNPIAPPIGARGLTHVDPSLWRFVSVSIDLKTGGATQVEIPNAGGAGASRSDCGDEDDILLTIAHPAWDLQVSLANWILTGPGMRDRVRPIAARRKSTGKELPLTVVPRQYRNDDESRKLIASGELPDPWKKPE